MKHYHNERQSNMALHNKFDKANEELINELVKEAGHEDKPASRLIQAEGGRIYRLNVKNVAFLADHVNPRNDAGNLSILALVTRFKEVGDCELTEGLYEHIRKHESDGTWKIAWVTMGYPDDSCRLVITGYGLIDGFADKSLKEYAESFETQEFAGIAFTTKEKFLQCGKTWNTDSSIQELYNELKLYNSYLMGNVYEYMLDEWHPPTCPITEYPDIEDDSQFIINAHYCGRFFLPMEAGYMARNIATSLKQPWYEFTGATHELLKGVSVLDKRSFDCPICGQVNGLTGYRGYAGEFSATCPKCRATLEVNLKA